MIAALTVRVESVKEVLWTVVRKGIGKLAHVSIDEFVLFLLSFLAENLLRWEKLNVSGKPNGKGCRLHVISSTLCTFQVNWLSCTVHYRGTEVGHMGWHIQKFEPVRTSRNVVIHSPTPGTSERGFGLGPAHAACGGLLMHGVPNGERQHANAVHAL